MKLKFRLIAAIVFLSGFFTNLAKGDDTNYFVLVTLASKQSGEIVVNGFPLASLNRTNPVIVSTFAEPFLVNGTNIFTLNFFDPTNNFASVEEANVKFRLEYGPEANEEGVSTRTNRFELLRSIEASEDSLMEEQELNNVFGFHFLTRGYLKTESTFQSIDLIAKKTEYRFLSSSNKNISEIRASLSEPRLMALPWLSPLVPLTEIERTNIKAVVRILHSSLSDKNFEACADLLEARLQRLATAFGTTLVQQRQKLIESYTNVFSESFVLEPIDETKIQYKEFPPANLVQVLVEGKHPIRGNTPEYSFEVPVYVSNINGTWKIVE